MRLRSNVEGGLVSASTSNSRAPSEYDGSLLVSFGPSNKSIAPGAAVSNCSTRPSWGLRSAFRNWSKPMPRRLRSM